MDNPQSASESTPSSPFVAELGIVMAPVPLKKTPLQARFMALGAKSLDEAAADSDEPTTHRLFTATPGELVPHGAHNFRRKTYVRQTPCSVCTQPLQGNSLQGVRCSTCKRDIHETCLGKVPTGCELVSILSRTTQPSGLPSWPPPKPAH